ncbi:hypothetical protein ABZ023_24090 [Streptomyces sp. NPDC006367]|uniref:hypothetical protein n=1 Tax=unclassified Streptomyces TaxID=2593676 RepID=UPI0033ADF3AF
MTTGSSSPRSSAYAISAVDPPAAETTTATGTHTVRTRPGQSGSDADAARSFARRPPARQEAGPRERATPEPASRAARSHRTPPYGTARVPAAEEPFTDEDLFTDEELYGDVFIAPEDESPEPAFPGPEDPETGRREPGSHEPAPGESAARADAARPYGDPVGDLVRAAVADRPLEEVVDLITMLEQSPRYAQATADALRAVGVHRSVEDVTRLVGLLTRPPRDPDSADEAIRAAAAGRPVEDVTRLMALLHRTPLEPHCGQAAVRAAATGRPVADLVELIGRLAEEERAYADRPMAPGPWEEHPGGEPETAGEPAAPLAPAGAEDHGRERRRTLRPGRRHRAQDRAPRDHDVHTDHDDRAGARDRAARRAGRRPAWPAWLAVAALAGCGVAYFPLHRSGASVPAYALALGLSALCLAVALLLTVRPVLPVLAVAVVGPAALAAAELYGTVTPSARLSQAADLALAPTWAAVGVAVLASLLALFALCVRVASQAPAGRRTFRPTAGARRVAD